MFENLLEVRNKNELSVDRSSKKIFSFNLFKNAPIYKVIKSDKNYKKKLKHNNKFSNIVNQLKEVFKLIKLYNSTKFQNLKIVGFNHERMFFNKESSMIDNIKGHCNQNIDILKEWFKEDDKNKCQVIFFQAKFSLFLSNNLSSNNHIMINPFTIILFNIFTFSFKNFFNFKLFRELFHLYNKDHNLYKSLISPFFITVFIISYLKFIEKFKKVDLLLLTANSVFIEILRILTVSSKENEIIEIMHGMTSPIFHKYLISFEQELNHYNGGKLIFISMISEPFCPDPIILKKISFLKQHSNLGVYKALNKILSENYNIAKVVNLKNKILGSLPNKIKSSDHICGIIGGYNLEMGFEGDHYNSQLFKLEIMIAEEIKLLFKKNNKKIDFLYFPHPHNEPIKEIKFTDNTKIEVYEDTQIAYFFLDSAISYLSTSMFEASFYGADIITPLPKNDGMFSKKHMEFLFSPINSSEKAFKDTIQEFVNKCISKNNCIENKIEKRLKLLNS